MSKILLITGMHRSATSLIASLFEGAGVHLGDRLLAPNAQNPRGFFEDVEFFEFHRAALRARAPSILVDRSFKFIPDENEKQQAAALIAARAAYPLWGWKDPRSCLFLDFWQPRLADARYLLLYRHPFDVLLSFVRRGEWFTLGLYDVLEAWYAYTKPLLEFHARYPAQTLLCHSYAVIDQLDLFRERVQSRFDLDLPFNATRYASAELRRTSLYPETDQVLHAAHPEAMALYAQLNAAADLPEPARPALVTPAPLTALAGFAASLSNPPLSLQRSLIAALLGVAHPAALETFWQEQLSALAAHAGGAPGQKELQEQIETLTQARDDWQALALEREQLLLDQQVWVDERMARLRALEAQPSVRALQRLGLV